MKERTHPERARCKRTATVSEQYMLFLVHPGAFVITRVIAAEHLKLEFARCYCYGSWGTLTLGQGVVHFGVFIVCVYCVFTVLGGLLVGVQVCSSFSDGLSNSLERPE